MSTAMAYTPEDLLAMPDGNAYELVGGQLVERNGGAESSRVGGKLYCRVDRFSVDGRLKVWDAATRTELLSLK